MFELIKYTWGTFNLLYHFKSDGVKEGWRKDTKKLDDLVGDEILVRVSQLVVNMSDGNNSEDTCDFLEKQQEPDATFQTTNDDSTSSNPDFLLNSIDNFVDDFEFEHCSRSKEDIFHQFKSLPINKSDVLRPTVIRMLIHATFIFDAKDFESIEKFFKKKKSLMKGIQTIIKK